MRYEPRVIDTSGNCTRWSHDHDQHPAGALAADELVWSESLVMDVVTRVWDSLSADGVPATRYAVERALAAAGIEPGAVR